MQQASTTQTLDNKLWMKNVVHVVGGKDSSESDLFRFYMNLIKILLRILFMEAMWKHFQNLLTPQYS